MGRKPIGKVAMTTAERVRRYRLKHKLAEARPTERAAAGDVARSKARIAEQNRKIAQLEAELARRPAPGAADVAAEALQAALARAQEAEAENKRLRIDLLPRHKVSLDKRKKVADLVRARLGAST